MDFVVRDFVDEFDASQLLSAIPKPGKPGRMDLAATAILVRMTDDRIAELKRCRINLDSEYGIHIKEEIEHRYNTPTQTGSLESSG